MDEKELAELKRWTVETSEESVKQAAENVKRAVELFAKCDAQECTRNSVDTIMDGLFHALLFILQALYHGNGNDSTSSLERLVHEKVLLKTEFLCSLKNVDSFLNTLPAYEFFKYAAVRRAIYGFGQTICVLTSKQVPVDDGLQEYNSISVLSSALEKEEVVPEIVSYAVPMALPWILDILNGPLRSVSGDILAVVYRDLLFKLLRAFERFDRVTLNMVLDCLTVIFETGGPSVIDGVWLEDSFRKVLVSFLNSLILFPEPANADDEMTIDTEPVGLADHRVVRLLGSLAGSRVGAAQIIDLLTILPHLAVPERRQDRWALISEEHNDVTVLLTKHPLLIPVDGHVNVILPGKCSGSQRRGLVRWNVAWSGFEYLYRVLAQRSDQMAICVLCIFDSILRQGDELPEPQVSSLFEQAKVADSLSGLYLNILRRAMDTTGMDDRADVMEKCFFALSRLPPPCKELVSRSDIFSDSPRGIFYLARKQFAFMRTTRFFASLLRAIGNLHVSVPDDLDFFQFDQGDSIYLADAMGECLYGLNDVRKSVSVELVNVFFSEFNDNIGCLKGAIWALDHGYSGAVSDDSFSELCKRRDIYAIKLQQLILEKHTVSFGKQVYENLVNYLYPHLTLPHLMAMRGYGLLEGKKPPCDDLRFLHNVIVKYGLKVDWELEDFATGDHSTSALAVEIKLQTAKVSSEDVTGIVRMHSASPDIISMVLTKRPEAIWQVMVECDSLIVDFSDIVIEELKKKQKDGLDIQMAPFLINNPAVLDHVTGPSSVLEHILGLLDSSIPDVQFCLKVLMKIDPPLGSVPGLLSSHLLDACADPLIIQVLERHVSIADTLVRQHGLCEVLLNSGLPMGHILACYGQLITSEENAKRVLGCIVSLCGDDDGLATLDGVNSRLPLLMVLVRLCTRLHLSRPVIAERYGEFLKACLADYCAYAGACPGTTGTTGTPSTNNNIQNTSDDDRVATLALLVMKECGIELGNGLRSRLVMERGRAADLASSLF